MTQSALHSRRPALIGALFAFIAAVAFSGKAILIKLAYRYSVDAVTLLTLRMVFSIPFFLAVGLWSVRDVRSVNLRLRDWLAVGVLGMLGYYLASLFDFMGLVYIPASLERLILFLYPTMVLLLSAMFLHQPLSKTKLIGLAASYAGIVLVFARGVTLSQPHLWLGSALVFVSALVYALYLVGCGPLIRRIGAARFTAYTMLVASIAIIVQFALTHPVAALQLPMPVYGLALSMAIFATVVPTFLLTHALHLIGSSKVAIISAIGPVTTLLFGILFLGEGITAAQLLGTLLVVGGVLWVSLRTCSRSR